MNIPEGYKLVPVEPTEEMLLATEAIDAGTSHRGAGEYELCNVRDYWEAMLAAAPTPPQPIYDEAKERELFERILGSLMVDRFNGGEYKNIFVENQWLGWLACAQSRAKSVEVGDV